LAISQYLNLAVGLFLYGSVRIIINDTVFCYVIEAKTILLF